MDGVGFGWMSVTPPSLPNPPLLRTKQREQTCACVSSVHDRQGGVGGFFGEEGGRGQIGSSVEKVGEGGLGMVVSWGGSD